MKDLKDICYETRIAKKLSQKDFATLIGSNQTEVSFIERGFVPESRNKVQMIYSYANQERISVN